MKLLKYFLSLIGYTIVSVTTAFLLALIAKLIVRAAQLGWGLLAVMLLVSSVSLAPATPVQFPVKQMFGNGNYMRPFTVTAVASSLTDNTNIFIGSTTNVVPTGGTNPIVQLTPNNYVVTFSDSRTPWRIAVPNTNGVLNALALTVGTLPTFNYNPPGLTAVTTSNSATVTFTGYGTSSSPLMATAAGGGGGPAYTFINTNLQAGVVLTNNAVIYVGTNLSSLQLANTNIIINGVNQYRNISIAAEVYNPEGNGDAQNGYSVELKSANAVRQGVGGNFTIIAGNGKYETDGGQPGNIYLVTGYGENQDGQSATRIGNVYVDGSISSTLGFSGDGSGLSGVLHDASLFDTNGAAQAATNGLASGAFAPAYTPPNNLLTNGSPLNLAYATNTLPMGTLTSATVTNGFLTTDGTTRSYSLNGGYLTNLNAAAKTNATILGSLTLTSTNPAAISYWTNVQNSTAGEADLYVQGTAGSNTVLQAFASGNVSLTQSNALFTAGRYAISSGGTNFSVNAQGNGQIGLVGATNGILTASGSVNATFLKDLTGASRLTFGAAGNRFESAAHPYAASTAVTLGLSSNPWGTFYGTSALLSGTITATNGFTIPSVTTYAGPVCSNGLAHQWNSNGVVFLRYSTIGATNWADKQLAP